MIIVTRLNGPEFALNPDLVERADSTPDTVITLVDGTKYVIAESVDEFIERIRRYRASVAAEAQILIEDHAVHQVGGDEDDHIAKILPLHPRER